MASKSHKPPPPVKVNDPILIYMCDTCYNLFFHSAFDENVFSLIGAHQDGLEHREQHPGDVQQEIT